jgi:hypothetical protein
MIWVAASCQQCGVEVRVDAIVERLEPPPAVYCALCFPFPILPDTLEPEDFA